MTDKRLLFSWILAAWLAGAALLCAGPAHAAPSPPAASPTPAPSPSPAPAAHWPWKSSPGAKEYPDAAAIILKDDIRAVVRPDGTDDLMEYDAIKLLNKQGVDRFGRAVRLYDSATETTTVQMARLWTPDGKMVVVPPSDIQDEVPATFAHHGIYQRIHEVTIDYPGVTDNCVIEYRFLHHRRVAWPDRKFWEVSYTQDFDPILNTVFTFTAPKNMAFDLATPGIADLKPEAIEHSRDMLTMRWHLTNRPALVRQPAMPGLREVASQVQVSNFKSWDDFAAWARAIWAADAAPDAAMKAKALSTTVGAASDEARIQALMTWLDKEKPAMGGELGLEEMPPQPASQLFAVPPPPPDPKNPSPPVGTPLLPNERAMLLLSMMKAVGLEPQVVLAASSDYGDPERGVPSLQQFDHILLRVAGTKGSPAIWVDPGSGQPGVLPAGLVGRKALILDGGPARFVTTPIAPPQSDREEIQGVARLDDDDSMDVELKYREYGANAIPWRTIAGSASQSDQRQVFQLLVGGINPTASLRNFYVTPDNAAAPEGPVEITLDFEVSRAAFRNPEGGGLRVPIPVLPQRRLIAYASVPASGRLYPLLLGAPTYEERRIQIVVPAGWKVDSLPHSVTVNNAVGSFQVDSRTEGRSVWYFTRLIMREPEVSVADYPQFKALMDQVKSSTSEVVVLSSPKTSARTEPPARKPPVRKSAGKPARGKR